LIFFFLGKEKSLGEEGKAQKLPPFVAFFGVLNSLDYKERSKLAAYEELEEMNKRKQ